MVEGQHPADRQQPTTLELVAWVKLYPSAQGGRKLPIFSGYRPPLVFESGTADGRFELVDCERLSPGGKARVRIHIYYANEIRVTLRVGTRFGISEGPLVGVGIVESIDT